MHSFLKKFSVFFTACRAYSTPISVVSWLVPFTYAAMNKGNIKYGILALVGIILLHYASNIFDDTVDYIRAKIAISKGLQTDFNFQEGKCICLFRNLLTLKQYYIITAALFSLALLIGLYFLFIWNFKLLYIIVPASILCLLYPILGCLGLGEIIVSIIFSPLLYLGVYFVMTGQFDIDILKLSISTGLLCIAVLHNHMLLDFNIDSKNRKITLSRLCGSKKNALVLLAIVVLLSYINLFMWNLPFCYLLPLLTLPLAYKLIKVHISDCNQPFLYKFLLAQKLHTWFTILLSLSVILNRVF